MISHACISAEGSESTVASTRAISSARPLPRARAQGQRGRARAPHVARQPQVHSIPQDHQHVTPLSANKITTTFSPLKMGAIYALPPDVPPFHSQIRRSPSLRMADLTGRRVSITSSNPPDSDRQSARPAFLGLFAPRATRCRVRPPREIRLREPEKSPPGRRFRRRNESPPARSRRNSAHRSAPAFQVSIARGRRRS